MIDETNPDWFDFPTRKALADSIVIDIDDFCDDKFNDGFRRHLGGSTIGQECSYQSWLQFRWAAPEIVDEGCPSHTKGQMRRLHQRGHKFEPELWEYLRGTGWQVWDLDPATGRQFTVSTVEGHAGGSCDAVLRMPEKYRFPYALLGEVKTHNRRSFGELTKHGMAIAKPEHWSQMNFYGFLLNLEWGAYFAVNKDNDKLHIEIVQLDRTLGEILVSKAHEIVTATPQAPPLKVTMHPTDMKCKFCSFKAQCHHGDEVAVNCRSCRFSMPVANKKWWCYNPMVNRELTDDEIRTGCPMHESITKQ